MNNSYGSPVFDNELKKAVKNAWKNHCVFVAARGNSSTDNPNYPACLNDNQVLNVGASGTDGERKTANNNGNPQGWSSSLGQGMDFIAPGISDYTYTTTCYTQSYNFSGCDYSPSQIYDCFADTSCSAPHVTGTGALMYSYHNINNGYSNNLTPEDIERLLEKTAIDKNLPVNPNNNLGVGYDDESDWGLINANEAIKSIEQNKYYIKHNTTITPTITPIGSSNFYFGVNEDEIITKKIIKQ
jgi:subtilisin family serine protease